MIAQKIKGFLPTPVKKRLRSTVKLVKYTWRKYAIGFPVRRGEDLKIIVGAAETWQKGWYSTNEQWLDITCGEDWDRVFRGKKCITHIVAEHVLEHLTWDEAQAAMVNIQRYLKDGGCIRIAVPDGYHPDPVYLKHVGINGIGDDAADHKQLLNVDTLTRLVENAGLKAFHLEGYDRHGKLVQNSWDASDGYIMRSRANGELSKNNPWGFPDANTSLIVDGVG